MTTSSGPRTSVMCSVSPMLSVRQGTRAVEFYKAAFGATEIYRVEDPGGSDWVGARRNSTGIRLNSCATRTKTFKYVARTTPTA